jgi:ubiquinone/menaquinone biosynthesis C-methylase UbiE
MMRPFRRRQPEGRQQDVESPPEGSAEDIRSKRKRERKKYVDLFTQNPRYGRSNHAKRAYKKIKELEVQSVCDVGCGRGDFCLWMAEQGCPEVYGVDFASGPEGEGVTWIKAEAWDLPLGDNSVEWITAFDMMEHLLPEDIERTLAEFARVAKKGFIFSICYRPSAFKSLQGETLHPTVRPESWWIEKISEFAEVEKFGRGYLLCRLRVAG